ncbi:MAG: alpha/beta hydrolase [Fibromonadales bacterium]|nr:alpha/beta hydrolase [Fibromonadales bacterium]
MNKSEITWFSGWASDVSVWEDEIYERFPNFSHRFVDYFDLISYDEIIPKSGIAIGWSMGTLALLQNLDKKPLEQKWILVCPIADFCAEGCWSLSAVRATRQGILQNTKQTLMSFSAMMGDVQKEEREKWVENAMRYSPKQLAQGLDYLMQKKVDLTLKETKNIELIFGEKDKIVPLAQKKLFPESISAKVCENLGHWLLDYARTAPLSALVAS